MREVRWIKSSRSANNGDCVELAHLTTHIAARDSKNRRPILTVPIESFRTLLQTL